MCCTAGVCGRGAAQVQKQHFFSKQQFLEALVELSNHVVFLHGFCLSHMLIYIDAEELTEHVHIYSIVSSLEHQSLLGIM